MPETSTRIIGFRLTPRDAKRLDALAARQGLSGGEMSRSIVLAYLDDTKHEHLLQLIEGLADGLASLHHDFDALRQELHSEG
jgi:hypothetical protein